MNTKSEFLDWLICLHDAANFASEKMGFDCNYTSRDVPHFRSDFPSRFGRFPWYYELVSRGRAIYISAPKDVFFAFSPSWSPGVNNSLQRSSIVLRPEIKTGEEQRLVDWVNLVASKTGKVIVKHIDEEQCQKMKELGLRQYNRSEGWDDLAREDDQTYPEVILDTRVISTEPEDFARNPIRNDVINGRYALLAEESLLVHKPHTKERLLAVFYSWIKRFEQRQPDIVDEGFITWHQQAFENITGNKGIDLYFLRDVQTQRDIGIFALARSTQMQIDIVFSFIAEERGNFQRVAFGWLLSKIHSLGYQWANLGGSERKSLFEFKKSLGSHELLNTHHLVCDPGKTS